MIDWGAIIFGFICAISILIIAYAFDEYDKKHYLDEYEKEISKNR